MYRAINAACHSSEGFFGIMTSSLAIWCEIIDSNKPSITA